MARKDPEVALERVRRICHTMPECFEKLSHGEPTFFVRKRVFAMCSLNHHDDGHIALLVPTRPGHQALLIEDAPETYYYPKYVGCKGWVGIEINKIKDPELTTLVRNAWNLVAPKTLKA